MRMELTDAEVVVEPVDLAGDEFAGKESAVGEDLGDLVLLRSLGREGRRLVAAAVSPSTAGLLGALTLCPCGVGAGCCLSYVATGCRA